METAFQGPVPSLSFDELSLLLVTDPAKFEELRLALIERVISAPGSNSDLLTLLQARLDAQAPTYSSCLALSEWLDESYQKLAQQITAIRSQA